MVDKGPEVSPAEEEGGNLLQQGGRASSGDSDRYEITVKGHLEEHWSEWLGGLSITRDAQGNSHLVGCVPDQAALHGILAQIRDLGLTLISLTRIEKEAHVEYKC